MPSSPEQDDFATTLNTLNQRIAIQKDQLNQLRKLYSEPLKTPSGKPFATHTNKESRARNEKAADYAKQVEQLNQIQQEINQWSAESFPNHSERYSDLKNQLTLLNKKLKETSTESKKQASLDDKLQKNMMKRYQSHRAKFPSLITEAMLAKLDKESQAMLDTLGAKNPVSDLPYRDIHAFRAYLNHLVEQMNIAIRTTILNDLKYKIASINAQDPTASAELEALYKAETAVDNALTSIDYSDVKAVLALHEKVTSTYLNCLPKITPMAMPETPMPGTPMPETPDQDWVDATAPSFDKSPSTTPEAQESPGENSEPSDQNKIYTYITRVCDLCSENGEFMSSHNNKTLTKLHNVMWALASPKDSLTPSQWFSLVEQQLNKSTDPDQKEKFNKLFIETIKSYKNQVLQEKPLWQSPSELGGERLGRLARLRQKLFSHQPKGTAKGTELDYLGPVGMALIDDYLKKHQPPEASISHEASRSRPS